MPSGVSPPLAHSVQDLLGHPYKILIDLVAPDANDFPAFPSESTIVLEPPHLGRLEPPVFGGRDLSTVALQVPSAGIAVGVVDHDSGKAIGEHGRLIDRLGEGLEVELSEPGDKQRIL
ncbi:MAG: hypothetical protein ACE5F1_01455 [Planctomycetota bacterium]